MQVAGEVFLPPVDFKPHCQQFAAQNGTVAAQQLHRHGPRSRRARRVLSAAAARSCCRCRRRFGASDMQRPTNPAIDGAGSPPPLGCSCCGATHARPQLSAWCRAASPGSITRKHGRSSSGTAELLLVSPPSAFRCAGEQIAQRRNVWNVSRSACCSVETGCCYWLPTRLERPERHQTDKARLQKQMPSGRGFIFSEPLLARSFCSGVPPRIGAGFGPTLPERLETSRNVTSKSSRRLVRQFRSSAWSALPEAPPSRSSRCPVLPLSCREPPVLRWSLAAAVAVVSPGLPAVLRLVVVRADHLQISRWPGMRGPVFATGSRLPAFIAHRTGCLDSCSVAPVAQPSQMSSRAGSVSSPRREQPASPARPGIACCRPPDALHVPQQPGKHRTAEPGSAAPRLAQVVRLHALAIRYGCVAGRARASSPPRWPRLLMLRPVRCPFPLRRVWTATARQKLRAWLRRSPPVCRPGLADLAFQFPKMPVARPSR